MLFDCLLFKIKIKQLLYHGDLYIIDSAPHKQVIDIMSTVSRHLCIMTVTVSTEQATNTFTRL